MDDRIRFHLDEHIDPDIARAIRKYGVDVTTTADAKLLNQPDMAHLSFIRKENRVIVTGDVDFLRFANNNKDHPGIVYCTNIGEYIGNIIRHLILIYEVLSPDEMAGRVEYL